jgi:hypothetical protein
VSLSSPASLASLDWQAYVRAMEPVVGLTVEDAWRAEVARYLAMAASNAALFADLPLDEALDEAAPVFVPGQL